MCGIVGIYWFSKNRPAEEDLIQDMCRSIQHRGPDDDGIFVDAGVCLGMRRLSIIDLSSGHQPVFNEDGRLLIILNGEIYNYRELRADLESRGHVFTTRSDTETVLHAFEEYGPNCTLRLNGMFAFAIFDRGTRGLFLARDHIGIKPLYYHVNAQRIIFGSEIKSLLLHQDLERSVDKEALLEYMTFGYVSGERTLFYGIRKLPAGHSMTVLGNKLETRQYWQLPEPSGQNDSMDYHADRLHTTFKAAVKRQMVSDVPLGAFLSGGMDSSSIVHMMRLHSSGPVNTYSIGFGSKYAYHDELKDARIMASAAETNHHEIIAEPDIVSLLPRLIWHLDEPVADSSYIVTYLVSQLAAQSVKVILSGVGGDELFGGYRRYLAYTLNQLLLPFPKILRKSLLWFLTFMPASRDAPLANFIRLARSFLRSLELKDHENQYQSLIRIFSADVLDNHYGHEGKLDATSAWKVFGKDLSQGDLLQHMQYYDLRHSLVDDLLLLTDKMSMACSLETRVPFLDLEMIELAASIPSKLKIRRMTMRAVQKKAMQQSLPSALLKKRKRGFGCPIGAWVRNDLREYIQDCLSPSRLKRHGFFEEAVVRRTLEDHYSGRSDHTDHLMSLLTFEIWYDTFINKSSPVGFLA